MTDRNIDHEGRDLTDLTPVEVDTLLLPIWNEMGRQNWVAMMAHLDIEEAELTIARETDPEYLAKQGEYHAKYGAPQNIKYAEEKIAKANETLRGVVEAMAKLTDQERPYTAEYYRRGTWHRYFLVLNSNGHIHRETSCSTCFPTTRYGWIVKLSGCDEEEMVEEYGETACTVCFPDAPSYAGWAASIAAKAEAEKASKCSETWPIPSETVERWNGGYGSCKCGARGVALTPNGKLRAHMTPEQEAAEAARKATFGHPDGKKLKDCTGRRAQKTPKGAFNALREGLRIKEGIDSGNPHPYYVDLFKATELTRLAEALALYNGTTADEEVAKAVAKNADDVERDMLRRAAEVKKAMARARRR